jgi:hypothetical protein
MVDVVLKGPNLTDANLSGANLTGVDFTGADLDGASIAGADTTGAIWSDTICPDGTNSSRHVGGCPGPLDTTPPVVRVTGVAGGAVYVVGAVPAASCQTTDTGTGVATPATLSVTSVGSKGTGTFTAICSGATDRAGNKAAPVKVTYTVGYGFGGFTTPRASARIPAGTRRVTVRLLLVTAAGKPIGASVAKSLGAGHRIRVVLSGPHISSVRVTCAWSFRSRSFTCPVSIPSNVRKGARYSLTAQERPGVGFVVVRVVGRARNPEPIFFG